MNRGQGSRIGTRTELPENAQSNVASGVKADRELLQETAKSVSHLILVVLYVFVSQSVVHFLGGNGAARRIPG